MSEIADVAHARRLTPAGDLTTGLDHPVLRGWRRLDDYTDPTGQAWVIERVEAGDGPAWLAWTLEDFVGDSYGAEPVFCSRRSDAVDVSNQATPTQG